jgi:hypothetical protein
LLQLEADPSLIANAVEEVLRFDSSVIAWRRKTTEAVAIGGMPVPADANLVLLPTGRLVPTVRPRERWRIRSAYLPPICYQGEIPSANVLITSTVAGLGTLVIGWLIFERYTDRARG